MKTKQEILSGPWHVANRFNESEAERPLGIPVHSLMVRHGDTDLFDPRINGVMLEYGTDVLRLAAAAPDLLSALVKLVAAWDSEIHNEYDGTGDLLKERLAEVDHARAAIAAAKGAETVAQPGQTWTPVSILPPLSHEPDDPHKLGAKYSRLCLVRDGKGWRGSAKLQDWRIDPDDEPQLHWVMTGPDGYHMSDITAWMYYPE